MGSREGCKRDDRDYLKSKKRKARRWSMLKFIFFLLVLFLIVVGAISCTTYFYNCGMNIFEKFNYVSIDKKRLDIDKDVSEELSEYRNIVLLGIDAREGEDPNKCRSDAVVLVSIHKKTGRINMTSVLRDSYLMLDEKGNKVLDKLTHAHAYGGPENTIRALNRNLDLNVREFMTVNWRTVAKLADAMGGIDMKIKDYEVDEMNRYIDDTNRNLHGDKTHIDKPGIHRLNGIQTVTYCRIRHVGNGDSERAARMRKVIQAIVKKSKTMSLSQLEAVANKVLPDIDTNIEPKEMFWLALKGASFKIESSRRWPYRFDGAKLEGVWYDAPIVLSSNVKALHEKLFLQKNYRPTDRVENISQQIIEITGYGINQPSQ